MKRCWLPFLLVATVLWSAGCQPSKSADGGAPKPKEATATGGTAIPNDVLTQGALAFGAPFESEKHYKIVMDGVRKETAYMVRRAEVSQQGDSVRVVFTNIGGPLHGNTDTYELRRDGVWAIGLNNANFSSPFVTLPAELKPGHRWTYKATIQQGETETTLEVTAEIVGKAEVSVPLGTFDAWKVVTTGTSTVQGQSQKIKDVMYYAEKIGMVKDEMTLSSGEGAGAKQTKILLEAVPAP
jgi:hypothetical protein